MRRLIVDGKGLKARLLNRRIFLERVIDEDGHIEWCITVKSLKTNWDGKKYAHSETFDISDDGMFAVVSMFMKMGQVTNARESEGK